MITNKYASLDENQRMIIDKLAEEYKELLLKKVIEDYEISRIEDISFRQIVDTDSSIKQLMLRKSVSNRKEYLFRIVQLVSLLYGIVGLFMYLIYNTNGFFTLSDNMGLIIAAFGFSLFALSYSVKMFPINLFIKKNRKVSENIDYTFSKLEIVEKWNEIEKLAYKVTNSDGQGRYTSLHKVIDKLYVLNIFNEQDRTLIKNILNARNQVVHSNNSKTISSDEINAAIKDADSLLNKLKLFENI